jgi:ectoine hydroxylase-related dioxygenase (phytanoyl-CoA dioxygenase family)
VNLLVCVEHIAEKKRSSRILLYPNDNGCQEVELVPGDVIVFRAGQIFHARTPTSEGERVSILTSGFR